MTNIFKLSFLCSMLLALSACDKISQTNYQKIKTGMDYQQVINILGNPTQCDTIFTAKSCQWGSDERRKIDIKFINDQVILYASVGLQN